MYNNYIDRIVNESVLDMWFEDEIQMTESSTIDALKIYFSDEKKELGKYIKEARKYIKKEDYKKALVYMNQAKVICKGLKDKINKLEDDAVESLFGNLIRSLIEGITYGIVGIIFAVDRVLLTRSLRAIASNSMSTERDYTENILQRLFRNYTKREVIGVLNFLTASIDKTIVSLKKLDSEQEKDKKILKKK